MFGDRAFVSGHAAQNPDGTLAQPIGKVGAEVNQAEAHRLAGLVALSVLGSLQRLLGDLDRVDAWLSVSGMVNVAPGFTHTTAVVDGFSELILAAYGPDRGAHARTAIGVAQTPLNVPVIVAAEVAIRR